MDERNSPAQHRPLSRAEGPAEASPVQETSGGLRALGKAALRRVGLRDVLVALLQYRARRRRERLQRQWSAEAARAGGNLHATLEFRGADVPYSWIRCGERVCIERDVTIWISDDAGAEPTLSLEHDVFVGRNSYLGVYQPISIGAYVMIGAYCYLISANHRFDRRDMPIQHQGFVGAPIRIEEQAWLGTHVVVLPGVTIGRGAIVAAGSLVNRDIPPYEIWGGMPAKFIKNRPE